MIQSNHQFAYAMTTQLPCNVQNRDSIKSYISIIKAKKSEKNNKQDFNYELIGLPVVQVTRDIKKNTLVEDACTSNTRNHNLIITDQF